MCEVDARIIRAPSEEARGDKVSGLRLAFRV